jgi:ubiquinone/menaquinone biosynthesis C-methylase UbiE
MYIVDNNIQPRVINRLYISQKISQYIKAYYFKKIPNVSKIRIMDVGGGNGDVLKNIGEDLNISKRNLYCIESTDGWDYLYTNKKDITYVFWDNKIIPNVIKSDSIDVVMIMVSLHHMTTSTRNALFDNLQVLTKPGSLLLIKEHDMMDTSDKFCIDWEHILYALSSPLATKETLNKFQIIVIIKAKNIGMSIYVHMDTWMKQVYYTIILQIKHTIIQQIYIGRYM